MISACVSVNKQFGAPQFVFDSVYVDLRMCLARGGVGGEGG